ncbi:MAG TPA: hypothetical protein PLE33_02240 [Candidatus Cloacimonas sp.]|jgi:hypothetical protein|nr:hypothetical protein [Candidatus Cloacimonas sp.]HNX02063.1 hypothetical protein [Candidatus Cloacimonas sp.]HPS60064.1 hypothetical protein [Candidatus Cloacimonas sp.]
MRRKAVKQSIYLRLLIFTLLCRCSFLSCITTENSASANALSGITILSVSPADFSLSPVIGKSGICFSWHQPFGVKDISVYGLHSAFPIKPLLIATGIDYLAHPDYRWQDEYLALSASFSAFSIGATQHLLYEKIEDQVWFTWKSDFAIAYKEKNFAGEIRCNDISSSNKALTLSAAVTAAENTTIASAYSFLPEEKDCYALASSFAVAKPILIQCSWQSAPARFGLGLKVLTGNWNLMYAVRTHTELGLTHLVDLGYAW